MSRNSFNIHFMLPLLGCMVLVITMMPIVAKAQSGSSRLSPPSLERSSQSDAERRAAQRMRLDPSQVGVPSLQVEGQSDQSGGQSNAAARQAAEKQAREMALQQTLDQFMPLESSEIRRVLEKLQETREAVQTPIRRPPKPDIHIENLTLDPATPPPTVNLATDTVTTFSLLDVTGQPWPIVDIAYGGEFEIQLPEPGGNIIRITPMKQFATGNMSIRLLDFTTPLTFMLVAGSETVHYRYDARLPDYGPNALLPIISGGGGIDLVAGDRVMADMIEGVIPDEARRLDVAGVDGRTSAYQYGEGIFVRTPHTLLSPSWKTSARSGEGLNVYYVEQTPILLMSRGGTPVKVTLKREQ